jgi:hypothetical protein
LDWLAEKPFRWGGGTQVKKLHFALLVVVSLSAIVLAQDRATLVVPGGGPASWKQEASLTESGATLQGYGTAISGNTLVTGAVTNGEGAVYVYTGSGSKWKLVATLTSKDESSQDAFGFAVAIQGDTIVVGAYQASQEAGAAYVFVKPKGGWRDMHETAKLAASDGPTDNNFGYSVAIDGNTIVTGAVQEGGAGAAYIFVKPEGGWQSMTQTAELTPSDYGGWLGYSVGVSGDTIIAGAPVAGPYTEGGAAYIYAKPANGWTNMTQTAKFTASDEGTDLLFGLAVGVSGDTIAATGPGDALYKGAVYLAVKPKSGWKNTTETAKVTTRDGLRGYYFGASLAFTGDKLLAGATRIMQETGAAYVFARPKHGWRTTWNYEAKLTASDGQAGDEFGYSVAFAANMAIVGAPYADSKQGAVYVFGQ